MQLKPVILWFERDLRLSDHPALAAAAERGPLVPVFVLDPANRAGEARETASRAWLLHSLQALSQSLRRRGGRLILRKGDPERELLAVARSVAAGAVYWSRRYDPDLAERDRRIVRTLASEGFEATDFQGGLLYEPGQVLNRQGEPYRVFSPFWKACLQSDRPSKPDPEPRTFQWVERWPASLEWHDLGLTPTPDRALDFLATWRPGEAGASARLEQFVETGIEDYPVLRDRPDQDATSRLSPYLHFGEVSPRQVWDAVHRRSRNKARAAADAYLRQLGWREFAYHLLHHFPHTTSQPMRPEFKAFAWDWGGPNLDAWQEGRTGYPFIDAGMRQLRATGWMHNRVRMIVASFLVKDLRLHWLEGARWFWQRLVDADLANNTLGWQWTAGCGADAAPFFRIFNPVTQARKFDPEGRYIRRWVPELRRLSGRALFEPWTASASELQHAGIRLGKTYPRPIVHHADQRREALAAFERLKRARR